MMSRIDPTTTALGYQTHTDNRAALRALDDLRLVVASEVASLRYIPALAFTGRNNILSAVARLRQAMAPLHCESTREAISLLEIITMMCFRFNTEQDQEGMQLVQEAIHLVEDGITSAPLSAAQYQKSSDAIENLWRWIDSNAY